MSHLFYYYGIIYLIPIIYNLFTLKSIKREDEKTKHIPITLDPDKNIDTTKTIVKKLYNNNLPKMIMDFASIIWMVLGIFTPEKYFFITLLILNFLTGIIMNYLRKRNNGIELLLANIVFNGVDLTILILIFKSHFMW